MQYKISYIQHNSISVSPNQHQLNALPMALPSTEPNLLQKITLFRFVKWLCVDCALAPLALMSFQLRNKKKIGNFINNNFFFFILLT